MILCVCSGGGGVREGGGVACTSKPGITLPELYTLIIPTVCGAAVIVAGMSGAFIGYLRVGGIRCFLCCQCPRDLEVANSGYRKL